MKIQQSTLDKIKAYILDTQANSTYNYAPHEPLEMCYNPNTAYQWNLCNCYKYLNRYLSTDGEKKGDIKSLYKTCHYAWFEKCRKYHSETFEEFRKNINHENYLDKFISNHINDRFNLDNLEQVFKDDKDQIKERFWYHWEYFQLATLLIQQHIEDEQEDNGKTDPHGNYYIDLETT